MESASWLQQKKHVIYKDVARYRCTGIIIPSSLKRSICSILKKIFHLELIHCPKSILQWGRPNPAMGPAQPDQGADLGAAPVAATRAAGRF
jgi:hypothetical protein